MKFWSHRIYQRLFASGRSLPGGHHAAADRVLSVTPKQRDPRLPELGDKHALLLGGTRRGKTGALELFTRSAIGGGEGVTAIDPHGAFARSILAWLANPANCQQHRLVHFLDPSSDTTFALNPLEPYDDSREACHDAANVLASVIESYFDQSAKDTPRLKRMTYVAGFICARKGLTVLELLQLLSLAGEQLRDAVLHDFEGCPQRAELDDLTILASRNPRDFHSVVESTRNRLVPIIGDPRLARILGQTRGLNPRQIMDDPRNIVLVDLSSLNYADAAFVGTLFTSMYFATARRRLPLQCARHRLVLDEAESLLTLDVARMCDQSAKYGLSLIAAVQRLGQLRARDDFIADALLTNSAVKICFGGLEFDSARYMAENLFAGHVDLQEFKSASIRSVAVGNDKVMLRSRSVARHQAEHHGAATTEVTTRGRVASAGHTTMSAWGSGSGDGTSASLALGPPDPMLTPPATLGQSSGFQKSRNTALSSGRASVRSSSHQIARAHGTATTHAQSRGLSASDGESEAFVTRYAELPSQFFSLEEQMHKATADLINLPRRECYVKVEDLPPYRMRTPDLSPAFKSAEFKREMLPRFLDRIARESPYLIASAEADAVIAARLTNLSSHAAEPERDPAETEETPLAADQQRYARDFWNRRVASEEQSAPGRPPAGDLDTKHQRFRVIDGDDGVDN